MTIKILNQIQVQLKHLTWNSKSVINFNINLTQLKLFREETDKELSSDEELFVSEQESEEEFCEANLYNTTLFRTINKINKPSHIPSLSRELLSTELFLLRFIISSIASTESSVVSMFIVEECLNRNRCRTAFIMNEI